MRLTLASIPGALVFRALVTSVVILILMAIFFSYVEGTQRELEQTSIVQTRQVINSALAVQFATHAVRGRLNDLNELHGGNPFEFLVDYALLPASYQGPIDIDLGEDSAPGWYYLRHRGLVAYKPHFLERNHYFAIEFDYDDLNGSGRFEAAADELKHLRFVAVSQT